MASPSTERVNQHLLTSLLPCCFPQSSCYTQTSSISHSANQIPLFHPAPEARQIWLDREGGTASRAGEGGFLTASPSLCFSLTVCDSSWESDCSHTLSPPMEDHIPHSPPPHPTPLSPLQSPTPTPPSLPHLQDSTWDCGNFYFQADFFSCSNRPCWA